MHISAPKSSFLIIKKVVLEKYHQYFGKGSGEKVKWGAKIEEEQKNNIPKIWVSGFLSLFFIVFGAKFM